MLLLGKKKRDSAQSTPLPSRKKRETALRRVLLLLLGKRETALRRVLLLPREEKRDCSAQSTLPSSGEEKRLLCAEYSPFLRKERRDCSAQSTLPPSGREKRLLCAEYSPPSEEREETALRRVLSLLRGKRRDCSAQSPPSLEEEKRLLCAESSPAPLREKERLFCAESLQFFGRRCSSLSALFLTFLTVSLKVPLFPPLRSNDTLS